MAVRPIFIFSAVRSGSTLLQRIVAAHEQVATASEPWLLLPHAYTFRRAGVDAEYPHSLMVDAIEDFCAVLPNGSEDYREELRRYVLRLYEKAAQQSNGNGASNGSDTRYFLDKSPGYCFVVEEIMSLFPEAKFIFLWRNPLSIVASIIDTWEPWHPTIFRQDLFVGLPRLTAAYAADPSRAHAVRYEDLLGGEQRHWRRLMDYLEIEFDPDTLRSFSQIELGGRMGDPTGPKRYKTLSSEPSQKWKGTLANPLRKEWCRRYLRFLGDERLATMGYDRKELTAALDAEPISMRSITSDVGRLLKDVAKEPIRIRARGTSLDGPNVIRELLRS
ncbi:MAG TPA: sulfotransferase [Solirubrobacteraceae bacterium]|nr:sulfotransferase [Solirubrobacteraceae bacterium]